MPQHLILYFARQLSVQHVDAIGIMAHQCVFEPMFVVVEVRELELVTPDPDPFGYLRPSADHADDLK